MPEFRWQWQPPAEEGLAVSTGAMLGGGRNVRSVYVSYDNGTNWELSYSRSPALEAAQGKMVTARMVQACFFNDGTGTNSQDMDDADADALASHFRDQLAAYRAAGVLCWSVGMEGGNPLNTAGDPNIDQTGFSYATNSSGSTSMFTSDGTAFKAGRIARLEALIEALADEGMVCCLNLFYSRMTNWLLTQADYRNAMGLTVDWLIEKGYRNVVVDLANEAGADPGGSWDPSVPWVTDSGAAAELDYFRGLWAGQPWRPPIGCSSRSKPGSLVMAESDIHWFHGNVAGAPTTTNPANRDNWAQDMLTATTVGPVVCNEDETTLEDNGPSTTALQKELTCFDAVNDIAGCSGGTMLASTWQRWHSDQATPFLPEPGTDTEVDTGDYWTRYKNFTRAWLDHIEAETGGLPAL